MTRLSLLLAVSCLGTGAALLGGRALLGLRPALTPDTGSATLERVRRWAPDPVRRREAALLLHSRFEDDPQLRRTLLQGQGWGPDPLSAVVLKNSALATAALEEAAAARPLWRELRRRFPGSAASADALYALGRGEPPLRRELLGRFPAHPAALAAALEAGPDGAARRAGTLHLARWGARWPGADTRLKAACAGEEAVASAGERARIAAGLAEIGAADAALSCLKDPESLAALSDAGRLSLARTLLKGDAASRQRGIDLLIALLRGPGAAAAEGQEALRLLAQQEGPAADAALQALPSAWQDSAAVAARRILADPAGGDGLAVLRRWPGDPASWDLQWELARRQLLAGQWRQARSLLEAIPAERLPAALAARQRFWLGYCQQQLGEREAARRTWEDLRHRLPGGYYGWRAAVQLGQAEASVAALGEPAAGKPGRWDPLDSGDPQLDRLWRLDQRTEAWEHWRERRRNQPPRQAADLMVEGRLRQGVGDDWTGFAQLEQAALRLEADRCELLPALERSLHPRRFEAVLGPWAQQRRLPLALLLGLVKQESRFSPTVHSAAGAVGLMQVLPSTASELAGEPVSAAQLEQPQRNAELGSLYLKQLLQQAGGDPLPAVAGYNAGPGAVAGWIQPRLRQVPELWVEGIPYPETRLYVKKVLGNAWSYHTAAEPRC